MNNKRTAVLSLTLIAGILFVGTLVKAGFYAPEEEVTPADIPPSSLSIEDKPQRLIIPAIDVDAKVQDVGVGESGNMAVPTNYTDVGWYRYGTLPGNIGSAVIDGHVNNGFGLSAVFADLETLKKGDDIYVEGKGGARVHFVVDDVETYARADVPRDILFNRKDSARLNLITCSGMWNGKEESYEKRTVVYAMRN